MNNRRKLVIALGASPLAAAYASLAEAAKKIQRIGYLFTGMLPPNEFLQGLRHLGYVNGQNIIVEFRSAQGKRDRLPTLASELARLKVDVIVAPSMSAARAAKQATTEIPIVYMGGGDPVATGIVASLAHPGGNITAILELSRELTEKRLQLLKEAFPKVSQVAVLVEMSGSRSLALFEEMKVVAPSLGLKLQRLEVQGPAGFDAAFTSAIKGQAEALIETPNTLFHANRRRIVEFANRNRLPAIFHSSDFVDAGGLMCYGENEADTLRRLVSYVDKILKGAKPADLPVEQPMTFELVINMKTAKALGITFPKSVLVQAARLIQ